MYLTTPIPVDYVTTWMSHDVVARLVVDDSLTVRWYNIAAVRLLGSVAGLEIKGDKFCSSNREPAQSFRRFIGSPVTDASSLCLCLADGHHLLCWAIRFTGASGERLTGLTMRSTVQAIALASPALQAAFMLTAAERRIVELLFVGRTAEEVGERLGTSVGTVRVHIRHIYDKLQVASREAMFHKIMPFALVH